MFGFLPHGGSKSEPVLQLTLYERIPVHMWRSSVWIMFWKRFRYHQLLREENFIHKHSGQIGVRFYLDMCSHGGHYLTAAGVCLRMMQCPAGGVLPRNPKVYSLPTYLFLHTNAYRLIDGRSSHKTRTREQHVQRSSKSSETKGVKIIKNISSCKSITRGAKEAWRSSIWSHQVKELLPVPYAATCWVVCFYRLIRIGKVRLGFFPRSVSRSVPVTVTFQVVVRYPLERDAQEETDNIFRPTAR